MRCCAIANSRWPIAKQTRTGMKRVNRKSEIVNGEWLPDMDLNHDKQIQSLLCYRYTIGQDDASDKLENFAGQSSRQAGSTAKGSNGFDAHPHPSSLPRGEGEVTCASRESGRLNCSRRLFAVRPETLATIGDVHIVNNRRMILPLPGERAGARAVVPEDFSRNMHRASRN
jgi:hypothetical protein